MVNSVNLVAYLFPGWPFWLIVGLLVWNLVWKGFALWKSARNKSMIWFIVFLIVNTAGILEILYLFVFSKMGERKRKRK